MSFFWWKSYDKAWVKGRVTIDEDCDNTEKNSSGGLDAGLGGVTVKLLNKYGHVVATTTTDANGNYQFDVKSGQYKIAVGSVSGYDFAHKDVGDHRYDSDVNSHGVSDLFYVGKGDTLSNVDVSLKPKTGDVCGTVFCDIDCDGVQDVATSGAKIVFEAEHMHKSGFHSFYGSHASGHKAVKTSYKGTGDLSKDFTGASGTYATSIFVQDENDGQSTIMVKINGQVVKTITLDRDNNGGGSDNGGFSKVDLGNLNINSGDTVSIWARADGAEYVRIDKLEFVSSGSGTTEPGKAGVTVQLLNSAGTVIATTTTDANGDYKFDGVTAGSGYRVKVIAPDGQEFTDQNVGGNDAIDSDVDGNGLSGSITVPAGGTVDVDAGLKDIALGSLSGRFFEDTNNNDQDDGNGNEPGVGGVLVELLDANGNPTGDSTFTAADGSYSFTDLPEGTYGVRFTDPNGVLAGKDLVNSNVGPDASDSDAIGDTTQSTISGISVVSGQDTPDNDAGVEDAPNNPPNAHIDRLGKVCEDDVIIFDVLADDTDPDNDPLSIVSVDGQAISEGQTVTLGNGVEVTLTGGELEIDSSNSAEAQALIPGEELDVVFSYGISDGRGGTDSANVTLTYCGEYEDLADFGNSLPNGQVSYTLTDENNPAGSSSDAYTLAFNGTGDMRLDGISFDEAYCLDILLLDGSPQVTLTGTVDLLDDNSFGTSMGVPGDQVDNVLNYILNQDYAAQGYTDGEVQGAVWGLLNGFIFIAEGGGETTDAQEILNDAKNNGTNYEVTLGGKAGVVVTPNDGAFQPFVIGVEYEDCLC